MGDFSQPCKGTKLKICVTADELPSELHLSNVDFRCVFCGLTGKHEVYKEEMVMIDDDNYVAIVDTSKTGTGEINMKIYVELPDADVPETGVREEIAYVPTGVRVRG